MNKNTLFLALFLLAACDKEDDCFTAEDFSVPSGYALSAGSSTVFINSSFAYDTDAPWVENIKANSRRFINGDGLYDDVLTQKSTKSTNFCNSMPNVYGTLARSFILTIEERPRRRALRPLVFNYNESERRTTKNARVSRRISRVRTTKRVRRAPTLNCELS